MTTPFWSAPRAPYACLSAQSRGRLYPEPTSPTRSAFQRDRDRIIHASAFRRLAHKTQVFVPHEGDHYRTRLTHTIEVSQIARALARALGLDDDLAEALALAHDLGHTCFGHTGEDALRVCMAPYGGFDHNAQALRIVTMLEHRYAGFDGLNLTWETLEGLVKHNGPLLDQASIPQAILDYDAQQPLDLTSFASAEAQCAAIADDIAYNAHDINDGLRAGVLHFDALRSLPFLDGLLHEIEAAHPALPRHRLIHELGRRVITRFVEDAIQESQARLTSANAQSASDVRAQSRAMVALSPPMAQAERAIKDFLFPHLYREERIVRIRDAATQIVSHLFERFMDDEHQMSARWAAAATQARTHTNADYARARVVCDYIAGMTDRYALEAHRRLFGHAPDLTVAAMVY